MFRADMVRASLPFAATAAAARLALAPDAAGRLAVERGLVRLARLVAEEAREGRAGGGAVAAAADRCELRSWGFIWPMPPIVA